MNSPGRLSCPQLSLVIIGLALYAAKLCSANSDSAVRELRVAMLSEWKSNRGTYDAIDMERISNESEPWHVERYLIFKKGSQSDALDLMKEVLAWRHSVKLPRLTSRDFPCEFLYGGLLQSTRDRKNRPALLWNLETARRYPVIRDHFVTYSYWVVDKLDRDAGSDGFGMVVPLDKIAVQHFDLELTRQFFPFVDRSPANLKYVLLHEPSMLLSPVIKIMISWMPERVKKVVHVTSGAEIFKYVKTRQLPAFAFGRGSEVVPSPYIEDPEKCANIWDLAKKYNWPTDTVQFMLEVATPAVRRHRKASGKG